MASGNDKESLKIAESMMKLDEIAQEQAASVVELRSFASKAKELEASGHGVYIIATSNQFTKTAIQNNLVYIRDKTCSSQNIALAAGGEIVISENFSLFIKLEDNSVQISGGPVQIAGLYTFYGMLNGKKYEFSGRDLLKIIGLNE